MSIFKPIERVDARWAPVEGDGLVHLTIAATGKGYHLASIAIGEVEGQRYGMTYEIDIDPEWHVKSLSIRATDGRILACRSPSPGRWVDANDVALPAFDGCIDIDLAFTPFTNTLPVRRTSFAKGQSREFTMFYVPADSLAPFPDGQRYTCIEPGRHFHFEETDGTFSAEIEFDEYGLVSDYPGLFRRIA